MNCNNDNNSKQNEQKDSYILPSQTFEINESDIPKFEKEALLGSPEAAFKLYQYYEMYIFDAKNGLYWLVISAENGHPIGQYNLACRLINKNDANNKLRARYWAKKSGLKQDLWDFK